MTLDDLLRRTTPEPNSGCFLWTGYIPKQNGVEAYPRTWATEKQEHISAHRYAWELYNKRPVPKGLFVCHKCDVKACINPQHLFVGTPQDNVSDMARKGRNLQFSVQQIALAQELYSGTGQTLDTVAFVTGISPSRLSRAMHLGELPVRPSKKRSWSRFSEQDVQEIRKSSLRRVELATKYHCNVRTISRIINGYFDNKVLR